MQNYRWLALMVVLAMPQAWADIWECVDASGNKRFTNIKSEAKGCRMLDVPVPNSVPGGKSSSKAETPRNFPRVDGETQKSRDGERRKILDQELANEQKLLDQAKKSWRIRNRSGSAPSATTSACWSASSRTRRRSSCTRTT